MRKTGFTLAEVLITLAIIGFIASITMPSLMTSTNERQAIAGLKKGLNTLTNAATLSSTLDGIDYGTANTHADIRTMLLARANADRESTTITTNGSNNVAVFFRDGTALVLVTPIGTRITDEERELDENDNLPRGIACIFDTNGSKGPNSVSTCTADNRGNCIPTTRRIQDQFAIRLRGTIAVPNDAAARWAVQQ